MLNQNYVIVGKKKNCRIALGAYSNPMCNVHDDFRCIVLVDHRKIDFSDPPFLNRFEKQMILYLQLLHFFIVDIFDFSLIRRCVRQTCIYCYATLERLGV